MKTWKTKLVD